MLNRFKTADFKPKKSKKIDNLKIGIKFASMNNKLYRQNTIIKTKSSF